MTHPGRKVIPLKSGTVLVGSDAHNWPGKPTTAHRAFVKFAADMKPEIIILNGDVIDAATISRHPPIGWEKFPTVKEELEVSKVRTRDIEKAAPGSRLIWTLGNHDARFETRLATVAPEYKGIVGVHLRDHFPAWEPAWSVDIGGKHGVMIKHRFKGGLNAAKNNAVWSGKSVVTGHLHRLGVSAVTDYSGTRWGVEGGMLGDPNSLAFKGYTEDNPLDWQQGFVVLTFHKGRLMWPETVHVVSPGVVEFRGSLIKV